MAAHIAIESEGLDGFNLIASFPGAGAYDLIRNARTYFQSSGLSIRTISHIWPEHIKSNMMKTIC